MGVCSKCYCKESCKKYDEESELFCLKQFKTQQLFKEAMLSESQSEHRVLFIDEDGTDRDEFIKLKSIESSIDDFVNNGNNLYLYSTTCGNGKTSWSIRLLQSYVDKLWFKSTIKPVALFINVPKFFISLKENFDKKSDYIAHIKQYVEECDLVIWDDVGTKVGTDFEREQFLNIIDSRVNLRKSNIYTSNIVPNQLQTLLGDRLHSRIVNLSTVIQLRGRDKRGISV